MYVDASSWETGKAEQELQKNWFLWHFYGTISKNMSLILIYRNF